MTVISVDICATRKLFKLSAKFNLTIHDRAAFIGPSGSGKTTLLKVMSGLLKPEYGFIQYGNKYWFNCANKTNLVPQKRHVGFVFQDYALFEHMTVAENISYSIPGRCKTKETRKWLKKVDLREVADEYPSKLSGGQRQRVAIARALAQRPKILLLDEPFASLDIGLRKTLQRELIHILDDMECPVILVTHDLNEARYLTNKIGVINNGQLLRFDNTDSLFSNPRSMEVAQALGWRNFLPIRKISDHLVSGEWGSLKLTRKLDPRANYLAIRPEHIQFSNNRQESINTMVSKIYNMGPIRIIELVLGSDLQVIMHTPWNTPVPVPGCNVSIKFPEQYLFGLYYEKSKVNNVIHITDSHADINGFKMKQSLI